MNKERRHSCTVTLLLLILAFTAVRAGAQMQWPLEPVNVDHPIINCFGEFQEYMRTVGGTTYVELYLHEGIDIQGNCAPSGPWVVTVAGGNIGFSEHFHLDPTDYNNYITIDDGSTTYYYCHLNWTDVQDEGEYKYKEEVSVGPDTAIAKIAYWPYASYHHLHFSLVRGDKVLNPFTDSITQGMGFETDNAPPNVWEILICQNNTNNFITRPSTGCWEVSGDLDIIAKASDIDPPAPSIGWQETLGIYRIEYSIQELTGTCSHNLGPKELHRFDSFTLADRGEPELKVIYKNASPANSESDYWTQNGEHYYYIVTNVDSTGNLSEANGYWDTDGGDFPDGLYQISVTAYDHAGGYDTKSEVVFVRNDSATPYPVEVYIKDRTGDMGMIPSNPNGEDFWTSPDIRVDAPPFDVVNATDLPFGPYDHDNPVYNQENRIYVRAHNLSCMASGQVHVHVYWADPSSGISASEWNEIDPAVTRYINSIPSGGSQELGSYIPWTPTGTAIGHRCLLVRLVSAEDPIENDYQVPKENNIAQKNLNIISPLSRMPYPCPFFIANPVDRPANVHLTIDRSHFPRDASITFEVPFESRIYNALSNIEGISVSYRDDTMLVGIWGRMITLHGFILPPHEKILVTPVFLLPEDTNFMRRYKVEVKQRIHGIITGGMTFVVPSLMVQ